MFISLRNFMLRPLLRSMSTSSTVKHRFFVYAPDKKDEGTLQLRLSVRDRHLQRANLDHERGFISIGGMITTPEAIQNPEDPKKIVGSTLIFEAESMEKVTEAIKSDIYFTSGVWDTEKIVIAPFFSAFPFPNQ